MNKRKMNLMLSAGLVLFAVAQLADHILGLPDFLSGFLTGLSLALEIGGMIRLAWPELFENSRFYHWKRRLVGREKSN